jgi:hypothetical protein
MRGTRLLTALPLVVILAACQPAAPAARIVPSTAAVAPAGSASATNEPSAAAALSIAADAILVTVSVTGGECADGPCGAEFAIHRDGRADSPKGGPTSIPAAAAGTIAMLASTTDWDAVRAMPFTGQCPTAYDGQKHVYAFPADTGDLLFDSCELDLSGVPVFRAIDAALFGG